MLLYIRIYSLFIFVLKEYPTRGFIKFGFNFKFVHFFLHKSNKNIFLKKSTNPTYCSYVSRINSEMKTQVRNLVRRFTQRTSKMQKRLEMPPTPSSSPSPPPPKNTEDVTVNTGVQLVPTVFVADHASSKTNKYFCCPQSLCGKSDRSGVLDPQGISQYRIKSNIGTNLGTNKQR